MRRSQKSLPLFALLVALLALIIGACSDDNPTGPGGGGITVINFSDPSPTVSATAGTAVKVKLAGGTLPYTIQTAPNSAVATASLSTDTLTITPVAAGSTTISVRDASPAQEESQMPLVVTITINVTGGIGGNNPFDFPIPNLGPIDGIVGVADVITKLGGGLPPVETPTAFAAFGANLQTLIYGGAVTVNGTALDTMQFDSQILYFKTPLTIAFDGSSTSSFNIAGAGTVPAFTDNIVNPAASFVTNPTANSSVSKSAALNVQWDHTGGSDSIMVTISSFAGGTPIVKSGLPNTGSVSISAAEMGTLANGSASLTLAKFRYKLKTVSSKTYVIFAETIAYVSFTITN